MYKAKTINQVEIIYSILRQDYPENIINIDFNKSKCEYSINVGSLCKESNQFTKDASCKHGTPPADCVFTNSCEACAVNADDPSRILLPRIPLNVDIKVIYGDTDSTMMEVKYNRKDHELNRRDSFKIATICGEKLTREEINRAPIDMEFEKVFQPFILLTKKRYIAPTFSNMRNPMEQTKLTTSGLAITRRNYAKVVQECYKEIINVTLNDSLEKAVEVYKKTINDIMNYDITMDKLVLSAKLAKSYKTLPVHVILADKMRARGDHVQIGDRLQYIFIETDDPKALKSTLGECPIYAKEHGLKFNRLCYIEQLAKPLLGYFKVVLNKDLPLLTETIAYTNNRIKTLGGKLLRDSDYKLDHDT